MPFCEMSSLILLYVVNFMFVNAYVASCAAFMTSFSLTACRPAAPPPLPSKVLTGSV